MKMKTIQLTDDDVLEIRLLADNLKLEADSDRRLHEEYATAVTGGSIPRTDTERNARKGEECLRRILKQCK